MIKHNGFVYVYDTGVYECRLCRRQHTSNYVAQEGGWTFLHKHYCKCLDAMREAHKSYRANIFPDQPMRKFIVIDNSSGRQDSFFTRNEAEFYMLTLGDGAKLYELRATLKREVQTKSTIVKVK